MLSYQRTLFFFSASFIVVLPILAFLIVFLINFNLMTRFSYNIITPLQDAAPRLRFHTGSIGLDGQPFLLPTLPMIPGPASSWYVAQWQQASFVTPGSMTTPSPSSKGHWCFEAPDGHSSVRIDQVAGSYAYTLFEQDGSLTASGGANLFLATGMLPKRSDFGVPVELHLAVQLVDAAVSYWTPTAKATGAVQVLAFVGLGLMFRSSTPSANRFVFMQIPIVVSRPVPPGPGIMCSLVDGMPQLLYVWIGFEH